MGRGGRLRALLAYGSVSFYLCSHAEVQGETAFGSRDIPGPKLSRSLKYPELFRGGKRAMLLVAWPQAGGFVRLVVFVWKWKLYSALEVLRKV